MSRVTGNENVKMVFRAYIRQKWINLRQDQRDLIHRSIIHTSSNTFHQRKCFVCVTTCNRSSNFRRISQIPEATTAKRMSATASKLNVLFNIVFLPLISRTFRH